MIRLGRLRKIISSKKIIIFLLVLLSIWILWGFSNASWIWYWIIWQEFTNISYQNLDLVITNNVNLFTNIDLSQDNKLLSITDKHFYFWSWNNLQFYDYSPWNWVPRGLVWNVWIYFLCDYVDTESSFSTFSNCQVFNYNFGEVSRYLSQVRLWDMVYYWDAMSRPMYGISEPFFFAINVSKANKLIWFYDNVYWTYISHDNYFCQNWWMDFGIPCVETTFDTSTLIDIWEYSYSNFPKSLLGNSPIASSIPTPDIPNVYEPTSQVNSWDIIDYYENTSVYDFNEWDCFVWTWDLDSNNDEDFRYNNWYHIFYFFKNHYNITNEYYSLSDVWGFINSLMYNYDTYYNYWNRYTNWDIISVKDYDFDSHRTVETFSWFTNPFTNKPLVYETYPYFLNYYHRNFSRAYDWKDLATYCYYKLGFSSHSTWYNWNDFSGSYICWNWETCTVNTDDYWEAWNLVWNITSAQEYNWGVFTINSYNFKNAYSYLSWNSVINSESWDWTPLDYFNDDIPSNFDEKNFISSSFTRFKSVFEDIDLSDLWDDLIGFLPTYIITFMLALMLFRFLQH